MAALRPTRLFTLLILSLLATGCALTGGGPGLADVEGDYRGAVLVQGQTVDGTLTIRQDGSDLDVTLDAPEIELTATGQGILRADGTARVVLAYDLQCPGEAELVGAFNADGTRFEGEVRARDCTGQTPGTFSFGR